MKRMMLAFVVVMGAVSLLAQADPAVGTWKLNPAKSKYDPGPVPKEQTITISAAGAGIKVSSKGTGGDGQPTSAEYTVNFDGKDVPATGNPAWDMTSATRVDKNTTSYTRKKGGKVVQTAKRA